MNSNAVAEVLVAFVRVHGEADRIYARRDDGTEASWTFPSYGDELPHDLVHLVVEAAFGLRRGFWGRVAAGVDPARVNADANRRGGRDKYAGFGDDRAEIMAAEALAAAAWFDSEVTDDARVTAIREECARYGVDPPPLLAASRVALVRAALNCLRAEWRGLGSSRKGTLRLGFSPSSPEASFDQLMRSFGIG